MSSALRKESPKTVSAVAVPLPAVHSPISPSRLFIEAAGLKPAGSLGASGAGVCAMCGSAHKAGDIVAKFKPDDGFTDYVALRGKGSNLICGYCDAAWCKNVLMNYAKCVVCTEGVFPAASNPHLAWWLLNPPKGPWTFFQSNQKQQHLVWRAPVNYSDELFFVRYGELVLSVRPAMLAKGKEAAARLAAVASENRKGQAIKSPFARLDRELAQMSHGVIRGDLTQIALERVDVANDIAVINSLTAGEMWGLTAVMYCTPEKPAVKPEAVLTPEGTGTHQSGKSAEAA